MYYDKLGKELTTQEWAALFEDKSYQRVALYHQGEYTISTIWLGSDHQFYDGPILIFETIVFGPDSEEEYCERYSTEEDAMEDHERLVELYKAKAEND